MKNIEIRYVHVHSENLGTVLLTILYLIENSIFHLKGPNDKFRSLLVFLRKECIVF